VVVENKVLRKKFGPKKEEVTGENCLMRSIITFTLSVIKQRSMRWVGHIRTYGRDEKCIHNFGRKT
jgi:hypothetical protein